MKRNEYELDSTLLARLDAIHMSPTERGAAMQALHNANRIVDAFVWVAEKLRGTGSWASHKPTVAH